jgi:hypothetical protein
MPQPQAARSELVIIPPNNFPNLILKLIVKVGRALDTVGKIVKGDNEGALNLILRYLKNTLTIIIR